MKVLDRIQGFLGDLNGHPVEIPASACLIDADKRDAYAPSNDDFVPMEQLVVAEVGEDVELGLFLDDEVLSTLERSDPLERLSDENLEAFLYALEGVSHFMMVVDRGTQQRSVSHLELELQAEVDKFVVLWSRLTTQGIAPADAQHFSRRVLFQKVSFHAAADELQRYRQASDHAHRFSQRLGSHRHPQARALRDDVRNFYRAGLRQKLREAA